MPPLSSLRMVNGVGSKCVERMTGVLCLPVGSLTDVWLDFIAEWGMADGRGRGSVSLFDWGLTVEIFLMHELIMHKLDNALIFAVMELVPI